MHAWVAPLALLGNSRRGTYDPPRSACVLGPSGGQPVGPRRPAALPGPARGDAPRGQGRPGNPQGRPAGPVVRGRVSRPVAAPPHRVGRLANPLARAMGTTRQRVARPGSPVAGPRTHRVRPAQG